MSAPVTDAEPWVVPAGGNPKDYPCAEPGLAHDPYDEDGEPNPDGVCTNCGLGNAFHVFKPLLSGGAWCLTCDSSYCDLL